MSHEVFCWLLCLLSFEFVNFFTLRSQHVNQLLVMFLRANQQSAALRYFSIMTIHIYFRISAVLLSCSSSASCPCFYLDHCRSLGRFFDPHLWLVLCWWILVAVPIAACASLGSGPQLAHVYSRGLFYERIARVSCSSDERVHIV